MEGGRARLDRGEAEGTAPPQYKREGTRRKPARSAADSGGGGCFGGCAVPCLRRKSKAAAIELSLSLSGNCEE